MRTNKKNTMAHKKDTKLHAPSKMGETRTMTEMIMMMIMRDDGESVVVGTMITILLTPLMQ